ncbi:MAG: tannase/feruloyl esterase family alpha/beta hydrolase [Caulobacteraceae bacterium]|nr:tannase/feruloyl esterase family alpha/beta hydrolase [Caulobacteraceae bacterium]
MIQDRIASAARNGDRVRRATHHGRLASGLGLVAAIGFAAPALASTSACEGLKGRTIGGATITLAESVAGGSVTPDRVSPTPFGREKTITGVAPICRVVASAHPSADSDVVMEVWMPLSDWNGRFVMWGNGGGAGFISYGVPETPMMIDSVRRGFATASTNTGHWMQDTPRLPTDRPERMIDFGYRAVHVTAVASKAIVQAYYDRVARYSYFVGCSTGGRQAMMSAQRFPDDFNGIISGAGVYNFSVIGPLAAWRGQLLADAKITAAKAPALKRAVNATCGATADGFVRRPDTCHFDPGVLRCKGAETDDCLTDEQVDVMRRLYDGPIDTSGLQLGFGAAPGAIRFTPPTVVYPNPRDYKGSMAVAANETYVGEPASSYMDAVHVDITPYLDRGGKLLMYHGWLDSGVPIANSLAITGRIRDAVGAKRYDDGVRLFLVPGMDHCFGGPGGNNFAQWGAPQGHPSDARHDIFMALQQWVEQNRPPETLVATKYEGDKPGAPIVRTTLLCPYPGVARYKGQGAEESDASYVCGRP